MKRDAIQENHCCSSRCAKRFQRSSYAIAASVFLNEDNQNWNDMSLKILLRERNASHI